MGLSAPSRRPSESGAAWVHGSTTSLVIPNPPIKRWSGNESADSGLAAGGVTTSDMIAVMSAGRDDARPVRAGG